MPDDLRERMVGEDTLDAVERLREYAAANDRSLLELAVSWLASSPVVVSVIAGAMSADQVAANASAAGWKISSAERAEIAALAPAGAS
jgi:aryl-alcohol dehydrogenase-like predicted oxidoreductase